MDAADECSVAIIGMSGRFPGAADLYEYWSLLREGREGISFFTDDELELVPSSVGMDDPRHVRAKGILQGVELFDAPFFNVPAREATWMDPQHRIFLECCWWALEDAGYDVERYPGAVSLYAGVNFNSYLLSRIDRLRQAGGADHFQIMLGNEKDHLATRVAYKLGLRGESISVQTSCSTSLVAVHMACQSILSGQSDMAMAGGVSLRLPQKAGYRYTEGLVASPDGHCRAFDEQAKGTVAGEGVGVVVLKALPDALRDGDHVYAVIRGSAINNDGHAKVGYTAPGVSGQAEVIAKALAMADVDPDTIGFVEAHGTGTPLGDPIEVEALTRTYRRHTQRSGYCALGSVKSNIGHLDTAAGVAGLMKAVLALRNRQIPPTLHFERPNPALRLEESPFYVNRALQPWPEAAGHPRRSGVSSFGIGGTNVHLVLQEAPERRTETEAPAPRLFTLSARTPTALRQAASDLRGHLERHPVPSLADLAYTLNLGRRQFPVRVGVVAASAEELAARLEGLASADIAPPSPPTRVAFMFAGQGSQSVGMAEELLRGSPVFRRHFEECARILADSHGFDLMEVVYPGERGEEQAQRLQRPGAVLPALFAVEYSLAQTWRDLGIEPDGLIGHSYGEYVAACVAGVFSLADGLYLAVERGRLMETLPPGAMLAVHASEEQVRPYLDDEVALATLNGDAASVLSGPVERIEALRETFRAERIGAQRLPIPFAYHSPLVESIAAECRRLMERVELRPPLTPFISNYTGDWITAAEATDPEYWVRQMRHTVRFSDGMKTLREQGYGLFLEIGPGQTVTPLARQLVPGGESAVLWSLPRPRARAGDRETFLETLGRLWASGRSVRWERLYEGERRSRVPLPGYPFERQRYWIEMSPVTRSAEAAGLEEESPREEPVAGTVPMEAPARSHRVDRSAVRAEYAAPQDELEREVVEIWEDVLGVGGVGRDDSFFDLGGDSLVGTQVYSRVAGRFPVGLELKDVLTGETPAALAARIRSAREKSDLSPDAVPRAIEPIGRIPRDGDLPLSYGQEWLWSVDQAAPGSAAYTFPFAARVRGDLRFDVLRATLSRILERHEVLRSSYPEAEGRPVQRIAPAGEIDLPFTDLGYFPESQRMERLREVLVREARRPFDLQAGPLFRARLLRLDEGDHVVAIAMHHIVSDAWSMGIFARELSLLYPAIRDGAPAPLPELPIQYSDFAAWQRLDADDAREASRISYWKRQLAGAPQLLQLPTDRPRPEKQSGRGARLPFSFSRELAGELRRVGREEKATLFMVLLSGFTALLHRLGGQQDMLVGIPLAGRNRPETEELIGCFINTVVVRADHSGNPRFRSLLQQVRDTTLEAYAHQDLPFERVVRAVQPQRSTGHAPLVQVLFDFQNIPPRPPLSIEGLDIEPLGAELATAKLDLVVDMWEREDGLAGSVEFSTDLFEPSTIRDLIERFEALLADAARSPQTRVESLDVATGEEKQERVRRQEERAAGKRIRFEQVKPRAVQVPGGEP